MSDIIRIASAEQLDIVKTFECGQCFRWNAGENGVYKGVAGSYPAFIWEESGEVFIRSAAPEEFWRGYFDMETDYAGVSEPFKKVQYLDECTEDGLGIRILRQNFWEALCSFIISQCNNIGRIKGIVERLCAICGECIEFDGEKFWGFPSAECVSGMKVGELAEIRAGYREQYIIGAAKAVASGRLDGIETLDYPSAKKMLLGLEGVGEKVANCVVLFGLHHMEAFPVDVWIRRALDEHFPGDFNPESLGPYAGLAQQYIFFHMRG